MTFSQLLEKAHAAGFTVEKKDWHQDIVRRSKHGRILAGVRRWNDGHYTDLTVELANSLTIRTNSAAARILGL